MSRTYPQPLATTAMNATEVDQEIARLTKMVEDGNRTRITLWEPGTDWTATARYDIPHHNWHVITDRPKREGSDDFGREGPRVRTGQFLEQHDDRLVDYLAGLLRAGWVLGE